MQGLRTALAAPGIAVLAVEMEGAAVAQVCHDYGLPFAAMRTISDRADDSAHVDFPAFVNTVATGTPSASSRISCKSYEIHSCWRLLL